MIHNAVSQNKTKAPISCLLLILSAVLPLTASAATEFKLSIHNPLTGQLEERQIKVTPTKVRVERPAIAKQGYQIYDLGAQKEYLVDTSDKRVITRDMNPSSSYNDKATLSLIGDGPFLLADKLKTSHYEFKAGDITCSHLFISKAVTESKPYLETLSMIPIKIAGMMVKPNEKACQRAARDAARQVRTLGMPLLITDKVNSPENTVFRIDNIIKHNKFSADEFAVPKEFKANTMDDAFKQAADAVVYKAALEKIDQATDLSASQKKVFRAEIKQSYKDGKLMEYLQKKGNSDTPNINTNLTAEQRVKHATNLLDKGKLEPAHQHLQLVLKNDPKHNKANYQLARYLMKTNFENDNSIIGFHYKGDIQQKTIDLLKGIINRDPQYYEAHSLLGHVYAVQGDSDNAAAAFKKADLAIKPPVWLNYNKALMHIQNQEYRHAIRILKKISNKRPPRSSTAQFNQYSNAWSLMKRVSMAHPQHETNPLIKNGSIKSIAPEKLNAFLDTYKDNKPVFLYFSSEDKWCQPCDKNNRAIEGLISKYRSKLNFINISFEPWNRLDLHPEILDKYNFSGLPANSIYHQGKQVNTYPGKFNKKTAAAFIDSSLYDIKNGKVGRYAHINDKKSITLLSYPFQQEVKLYYQNRGHKALAVSFDEHGRWASYRVSNKKDQKTATERALKECETNRKNRNVDQACVLFAEGKQFKFKNAKQQTLDALKQEFAALADKTRGEIEIKLSSFFEKKYKTGFDHYKALALATNSRGAWQTGSANGYLSQQGAIDKAMRNCEKLKKNNKITNACKLYAVGDKKVYGKSQQEIKQIISSMPAQQTKMDKNYERYKKYKKFKAMALVTGNDGKWSSRWSYGYKSQAEANAAALKGCEKNRASKSINGECRLYAVGNKLQLE